MKVTRSHQQYAAPTAAEIENILKRNDLDISPATLASTSGALDAAAFHLIESDIRPSLLDPTETENPAQAAVIQQLLQNTDFNQLTGHTPLEKAVSFQRLLGPKDELERTIRHMQQGNLDSGEEVERLVRQMAAKQTASEMIKKGANKFLNEQINADEDNPELTVQSLSELERKTLNALSIIKRIGALKAKNVIGMKASMSGNIIQPKLMESHLELPRLLDMGEMVLPDFESRLANMDLMVKKRFEEEFAMFVGVIKIDRSGSMSSDWKQAYVRAIMLHYFDMLRDGRSMELYIGTFERKSDGVKRISNTTEAHEFYEKYRAGRGLDTDVNNVIEDIQGQLMAGKLAGFDIPSNHMPELIIVNDGQDRIEYKKYDKPIHVISLEQENDTLRNVAQDSGGSFHLFHRDSVL